MTYPKTPSQFRKQAEASFRRANPEAVDIEFDWEFVRRVTFPTGLKGFSAVGRASASGFKSKTIVATATPDTGLSVR